MCEALTHINTDQNTFPDLFLFECKLPSQSSRHISTPPPPPPKWNNRNEQISSLFTQKTIDLIYCISFGKVSNLASHGIAHTKLRQHACTFILFYKNQPVTQTKRQKRKMNRCLYLYIFFTLLHKQEDIYRAQLLHDNPNRHTSSSSLHVHGCVI